MLELRQRRFFEAYWQIVLNPASDTSNVPGIQKKRHAEH